MASQCLDRRLPPLGITFIDFSPTASGSRRRRRSHGGYTPHTYTPIFHFGIDSEKEVPPGLADATLSTEAPGSPTCSSHESTPSTLEFNPEETLDDQQPRALYSEEPCAARVEGGSARPQQQLDRASQRGRAPASVGCSSASTSERPQQQPPVQMALSELLWRPAPEVTRQPASRRAGAGSLPIGAAPPRKHEANRCVRSPVAAEVGSLPNHSPVGSGPFRSSRAPAQFGAGVTTVMIRNLPLSIRQQDLMKELDEDGFAGLFDFAYAPCSFRTGEAKGFAFVNFCSASTVASFVSSWHQSRRFGLTSRDPHLNLSPAEVQGLQENLAKWSHPRMRRIRNPNLRPWTSQAASHREDPIDHAG